MSEKPKGKKATSDKAKAVLEDLRAATVDLIKAKSDSSSVDLIKERLDLSDSAAQKLIYSGIGSLENLLAALSVLRDFESERLASLWVQTVTNDDPPAKSLAQWLALPLNEQRRLLAIQALKLTMEMSKGL